MAYQTVNPANNQLIKEYPPHTDADIEAALQKADALYHSDWSRGEIDQRLPVLHKLADLIDSRVEELAKIASQEMGKLIEQSRGEVKLCAQIARYYADNAKQFLVPVPYKTEFGDAWVEHHPIGVIMAVEPWNFPYYQLMRVLAPNLAAGNPVLAKHASIVPHCAETFAHLVREAGAPDGAWTNLFISSDQVANIIADPRVQGAALTGSEKAGSAVAAQAAKHIKKSTLELGGNDVFVVLDNADLEKAVKNGATLHVGGKPLESKGNFFEPTILTHITRDNPAYFEEFFGPVAQMYVVKDDDEAVKLANDSHYGLGGAVFSQDIERAKRMCLPD